jgi:hypothetical protein
MTAAPLSTPPGPSATARPIRFSARMTRAATTVSLACLALPLGSCAVAAFPCRVASATLKIVPVVGHPAAVPFDACSDAID